MRFNIVSWALLAIACTDRGAVSDSARPVTDHTAPQSTECGGAFYDHPVKLRHLDGVCDSPDQIRYLAETDGWAAHVEVYLLETSAAEPREEDHFLASTAFEPCGAWDILQRDLTVVDESMEAVADESTHFDCASHDEASVTLVATVVDVVGDVVDCAIVGHDPIGLLEGDYDAWIGSERQDADWTRCIVLTQLGAESDGGGGPVDRVGAFPSPPGDWSVSEGLAWGGPLFGLEQH